MGWLKKLFGGEKEDNSQSELRKAAGILRDYKRYVWLMNHGFCQSGVKGLLNSIEITKDDETLLLAPVWSEQADTYIYKKSGECATHTAYELQSLLSEFWSSSLGQGSL